MCICTRQEFRDFVTAARPHEDDKFVWLYYDVEVNGEAFLRKAALIYLPNQPVIAVRTNNMSPTAYMAAISESLRAARQAAAGSAFKSTAVHNRLGQARDALADARRHRLNNCDSWFPDTSH